MAKRPRLVRSGAPADARQRSPKEALSRATSPARRSSGSRHHGAPALHGWRRKLSADTSRLAPVGKRAAKAGHIPHRPAPPLPAALRIRPATTPSLPDSPPPDATFLPGTSTHRRTPESAGPKLHNITRPTSPAPRPRATPPALGRDCEDRSAENR